MDRQLAPDPELDASRAATTEHCEPARAHKVVCLVREVSRAGMHSQHALELPDVSGPASPEDAMAAATKGWMTILQTVLGAGATAPAADSALVLPHGVALAVLSEHAKPDPLKCAADLWGAVAKAVADGRLAVQLHVMRDGGLPAAQGDARRKARAAKLTAATARAAGRSGVASALGGAADDAMRLGRAVRASQTALAAYSPGFRVAFRDDADIRVLPPQPRRQALATPSPTNGRVLARCGSRLPSASSSPRMSVQLARLAAGSALSQGSAGLRPLTSTSPSAWDSAEARSQAARHRVVASCDWDQLLEVHNTDAGALVWWASSQSSCVGWYNPATGESRIVLGPEDASGVVGGTVQGGSLFLARALGSGRGLVTSTVVSGQGSPASDHCMRVSLDNVPAAVASLTGAYDGMIAVICQPSVASADGKPRLPIALLDARGGSSDEPKWVSAALPIGYEAKGASVLSACSLRDGELLLGVSTVTTGAQTLRVKLPSRPGLAGLQQSADVRTVMGVPRSVCLRRLAGRRADFLAIAAGHGRSASLPGEGGSLLFCEELRGSGALNLSRVLMEGEFLSAVPWSWSASSVIIAALSSADTAKDAPFRKAASSEPAQPRPGLSDVDATMRHSGAPGSSLRVRAQPSVHASAGQDAAAGLPGSELWLLQVPSPFPPPVRQPAWRTAAEAGLPGAAGHSLAASLLRRGMRRAKPAPGAGRIRVALGDAEVSFDDAAGRPGDPAFAWDGGTGKDHRSKRNVPEPAEGWSGKAPAGSHGPTATNVRVVARVRPMLDGDLRRGAEAIVLATDRRSVEVVNQGAHVPSSFRFDRVFGPMTLQEEVYDESVADVVAQAVQGFHSCVLAYGQTGSGKTFSLEGSGGLPCGAGAQPGDGIIARAVRALFDTAEATGASYGVKLSHLEIYNEELIDLLREPAQRRRLPLPERKDPWMVESVDGDIVQGLTMVPARSSDEALRLLNESTRERHVLETRMNSRSSRSHSIVTLWVDVLNPAKATRSGTPASWSAGSLQLVDLAGSENIERSGSSGAAAAEASTVNKSLLGLGRVVRAVSVGQAHIPYRDSKLTRVLRRALGGDAYAVMLLNLSPSSIDVDESLSTLRYAVEAARVINLPKQAMKATLEPDRVAGEGTSTQGLNASFVHLDAGLSQSPVQEFPGHPRRSASAVEGLAGRQPWLASVPTRTPRRDLGPTAPKHAGGGPLETGSTSLEGWAAHAVRFEPGASVCRRLVDRHPTICGIPWGTEAGPGIAGPEVVPLLADRRSVCPPTPAVVTTLLRLAIGACDRQRLARARRDSGTSGSGKAAMGIWLRIWDGVLCNAVLRFADTDGIGLLAERYRQQLRDVDHRLTARAQAIRALIANPFVDGPGSARIGSAPALQGLDAKHWLGADCQASARRAASIPRPMRPVWALAATAAELGDSFTRESILGRDNRWPAPSAGHSSGPPPGRSFPRPGLEVPGFMSGDSFRRATEGAWPKCSTSVFPVPHLRPRLSLDSSPDRAEPPLPPVRAAASLPSREASAPSREPSREPASGRLRAGLRRVLHSLEMLRAMEADVTMLAASDSRASHQVVHRVFQAMGDARRPQELAGPGAASLPLAAVLCEMSQLVMRAPEAGWSILHGDDAVHDFRYAMAQMRHGRSRAEEGRLGGSLRLASSTLSRRRKQSAKGSGEAPSRSGPDHHAQAGRAEPMSEAEAFRSGAAMAAAVLRALNGKCDSAREGCPLQPPSALDLAVTRDSSDSSVLLALWRASLASGTTVPQPVLEHAISRPGVVAGLALLIGAALRSPARAAMGAECVGCVPAMLGAIGRMTGP